MSPSSDPRNRRMWVESYCERQCMRSRSDQWSAFEDFHELFLQMLDWRLQVLRSLKSLLWPALAPLLVVWSWGQSHGQSNFQQWVVEISGGTKILSCFNWISVFAAFVSRVHIWSSANSMKQQHVVIFSGVKFEILYVSVLWLEYPDLKHEELFRSRKNKSRQVVVRSRHNLGHSSQHSMNKQSTSFTC